MEVEKAKCEALDRHVAFVHAATKAAAFNDDLLAAVAWFL